LTGEVLTSSANSSDEARLDIIARVCWQRGQRAFKGLIPRELFLGEMRNISPVSFEF
jgi:hypothetical protein